MSNDKYDATFGGQTPDVQYFDPPFRNPEPPAKRKPPLVARVGAAVVMGGIVIWGVLGFVIANGQGRAYDACIDKIAQSEGHDAAEIAMRDGECR